jgi:hypothetical protein
MTACDLIVSLTDHARAADALHLAGLLYSVLGLALLGWRKIARSDRRGHAIADPPGPRVGFALIALGLLLQALAQAAGACR